jgi:hypothetical protein
MNPKTILRVGNKEALITPGDQITKFVLRKLHFAILIESRSTSIDVQGMKTSQTGPMLDPGADGYSGIGAQQKKLIEATESRFGSILYCD